MIQHGIKHYIILHEKVHIKKVEWRRDADNASTSWSPNVPQFIDGRGDRPGGFNEANELQGDGVLIAIVLFLFGRISVSHVDTTDVSVSDFVICTSTSCVAIFIESSRARESSCSA